MLKGDCAASSDVAGAYSNVHCWEHLATIAICMLPAGILHLSTRSSAAQTTTLHLQLQLHDQLQDAAHSVHKFRLLAWLSSTSEV